MSKYIALLLFVITGNFLAGQSPKTDSKNAIGLVFSPGYQSSNAQIYTFGIRSMRTVNQVFGAGLEVDYQQSLNMYGNSDALTGIGFFRIKPFKSDFFSEFGLQYYQIISSSRAEKKIGCLPYISLGYRVRLNNRLNLEFQFRPIAISGREITVNFTTQRNIPAKCFIGINYSF